MVYNVSSNICLVLKNILGIDNKSEISCKEFQVGMNKEMSVKKKCKKVK